MLLMVKSRQCKDTVFDLGNDIELFLERFFEIIIIEIRTEKNHSLIRSRSKLYEGMVMK